MKTSVPPSYLLITKLVVVNDQGNVLTMRRSKSAPRRPWTWDFPGGVVEYGEQPLESRLREAKEGAGLDIKSSDLKLIGLYSHPRNNEQAVIVFYCCDHTSERISLSYEHDEYKWASKKEFQALETPNLFRQVVDSI